MKRRYALAPQAARDLVQIWRYIKKESSEETADRVESAIRDKCVRLANFQILGTGGATSPTLRCGFSRSIRT